jgi:hypothetical protein
VFDVRFGSKADMCGAKTDVCFTAESGHQAAIGFLQTRLFDY